MCTPTVYTLHTHTRAHAHARTSARTHTHTITHIFGIDTIWDIIKLFIHFMDYKFVSLVVMHD